MLGLRQFLKKENGMCPICAIPYIREKRTLKVGYFDASYNITVWTMHCPECGYEVIMPGLARIHTAAESKQDIRPGRTETETVSCETMTITGPVTQQDGDGDGKEPAETFAEPAGCVNSTGDKTTGPAEGTERTGDSTKTMNPLSAIPAVSEDTGNTRMTGKKADGRKPLEKPEKDSGQEKPGFSAKESRNADGAVPGQPGHRAKMDRTAGSVEGTGEKADMQVSGTRDKKEPDKEAYGLKNSAGKPVSEKTPARPERRKQPQKDVGSSSRKQSASHEPPESPASRTPAIQPVPKRGQPGVFTGGSPAGFPGSRVFPSSAFSNLEAVRASIQADMNGKDGREKGKQTAGVRPGKEKAAPESPGNKGAGQAGTGREPAHGMNKTPSTEGAGIKCEGTSAENRGLQPDVKDVKQETPADNKNQKKTIQTLKTLSAKDQPAEPQPVKPARSSGRQEEKTLSAENREISAKATVKEITSTPGETGGIRETRKFPDIEESRKVEGTGKKPVSECRTAGKGNEKAGAEMPQETPDKDPEAENGKKTGGDGTGKKKEDGDAREVPKDEREPKDFREQAMEATRKLSDKIPADLVEKIPVLSRISRQQKHSIFLSEEKRFLEQHVPHKQVIINDLIYDTDSSEMFLRVNGQYGLDNPCVHYNYRTQNGNFFRCTVKYKHEDSIRALDLIEVRRMLEEYPDLYRKFFPDSVTDA